MPLLPLEGYTVGVTADRRASEQAELLRQRGARVIDAPAIAADDVRAVAALVRATVEGRVHAITFTSAPAVRDLFAVAERSGARDGLRDAMNTRVVAVCVGRACAASARQEGIVDPFAPTGGRLGLMVRALSERLHAGRAVLALTEAILELQGQVALVGDQHVQLTPREAGVLAALAAKPGAVVSPARLLRTVWSGTVGDEHVVGVTIGRLRRKLGAAGRCILTVPRRGYRLEVAPV